LAWKIFSFLIDFIRYFNKLKKIQEYLKFRLKKMLTNCNEIVAILKKEAYIAIQA